MKRFLLLFASTGGLLCLAAGPASAQVSTPQVQWSYNFSPTQSFVQAVSSTPGGTGGTVTFTDEPATSATNSSDVAVTNLRVSSTASSSSPDTLTNAPYSIGLQLTDKATGAVSSTLLVNGQLGGTFSANNSNVTNTFLPATLGSGWTQGGTTAAPTYTWTAPHVAGSPYVNTYTVSLSGYTPPGPPTDSNAGSISAHVSVTQNPYTSGVATPEPSTLVLSCLGLAFAGAASWRKRRRSLASMLA